MIQTVWLDLDDTLLDFHKAEARALKETLLKLEIVPKEETIARYSQINDAQWKLLEQGKLTRPEILIRRFSLLFDELGIARDAELANAMYKGFLAQGHYFIDGAPALLDALAPKYALYLVSNGNAEVQDSRIQSAGIAKYFQAIFISQRVGFDKPAREFFMRCFAQVPDFAPETAIIIGDSLTSDIQGGIRAGIRTCWFNRAKKPGRVDIKADYEITQLYELPPLLEKL